MMFLKTSIFFFGLSVALAHHMHVTLKGDAKLQRLKTENAVLADTHQSTSQGCFEFYKPLLADITTKYEAQYADCITAYNQEIAIIDQSYAYSREHMERRLLNSCSNLLDCKNLAYDSLKLFQCADTNAAESAKYFYDLSTDATDIATTLKGQISNLKATQDICINEAEKGYVTETAQTYEQLNFCLKSGGLTTPMPTPPTAGTTTPDYYETTADIYYTT